MSSQPVFGIKSDMIYKIIRDTAAAAGVSGIAPHDARRFYGRRARKGGAPLEQIQRTLGHASIRTTEIYVNMPLEMERGKAAGDFIDLDV